MKFEPFRYSDKQTPIGYACQQCGVTGVRLWRAYNSFLNHQRLLCGVCRTDWMTPAVPTEDGTTFWGATSVPPEGAEWWNGLPETAIC